MFTDGKPRLEWGGDQGGNLVTPQGRVGREDSEKVSDTQRDTGMIREKQRAWEVRPLLQP